MPISKTVLSGELECCSVINGDISVIRCPEVGMELLQRLRLSGQHAALGAIAAEAKVKVPPAGGNSGGSPCAEAHSLTFIH